MAGSVAKVAPGAVAWISTFSVDALSCAGAYWFSTRSACPAWPGLYAGRFLEPSAWPPMKRAATRSSQPKTAVFRCAALQPATRSVRLGRSRRCPGGSCASPGGEIGNTELCGWRIGVPLCWRRWVLVVLVGRGLVPARELDPHGRGQSGTQVRRQRARTAKHFLRRAQRVFRRAEQRPGGARVQPGRRDEHVVEEQEKDQADAGDGQRLRQRVDVEAPAAGAVRPVRVVAEVVSSGAKPRRFRVVLARCRCGNALLPRFPE